MHSAEQKKGIQRTLFGIAGFIALVLGLVFSTYTFREVSLSQEEAAALGYIQFEQARPVVGLAMINQDGDLVSESAFLGRWNLLYFGFTYCPDICPISANLMSNAIDQLNRENHSIENIKFFFVTVDPARDNPDRVKEFLSNFSNNLIGLTGTHENLMPIWKDFFVHVEPATNSEHQNYLGTSEQSDEISDIEKNYMVQHTAFYYIFDDDDVLRSILPFGSSIEQMVEDLKNL